MIINLNDTDIFPNDTISIIYDDGCPVCSYYISISRIEEKFGKVNLIKARNNGIGFQHISQILSLPGASKGRLSELIGEVTVYCYVPQVDPLQSSDYMKNLLRSLPSYSSGPGPGRAFKLKATNNLGAGSNITIDAYLGITDEELNPIKILNWQSNY